MKVAHRKLTSDFASAEPAEIKLQDASLDIWDKKYRLTKKDGSAIDETIDDTYKRVARALADVETTFKKQDVWYERFLWALRKGAVPAGRVISNAGAQEHKPATSTINCTVSGTVRDSMDDILNKVHEAGLTLKAGCGIGYEFSTLRPKGAYVSGAGAYTSGPLSFMDIYDKMCFTVSSAGGRRGAQMATFDVGHPDVMDFIRAKREAGRLRQFNLSLLVTREFMEAVRADDEWQLAFPVTQREADEENIAFDNPDAIVWRNWPAAESYVTRDDGKTACKVYKTVRARRLWDMIMASNYDYAEPGFILIDEVNEMNNNWFCENIRATNPCGEQPLPPYGSCLLGSVNLTKFVLDPFTDRARFDWDAFHETVSIFTRMLDNVVEINGLPLGQQREEIFRKRRHGMGYLGLGSTLALLCMEYGSEESLEFTERVSREMAVVGWRAALELSLEKGPAPIMEEEFSVTENMLRRRPEMREAGYQIGDRVPGKVLHAKFSRYMQHHYARNVIREGKKTKEKVDVFSYELLAYRQLINADAMPGSEEPEQALPDYFVAADDITPKAHVEVQAAAQNWVDSSISKTANVPTDYPYDDFKDIYMSAYENGLKGCTTFRFNPEAFQGVLVKDKDLENTVYCFTLDDGTEVCAKGNEDVEYDGEIHTAANLYDAIKEGYYGKF
jgi:ribonucleoside-diphosphate reductase alpha chain